MRARHPFETVGPSRSLVRPGDTHVKNFGRALGKFSSGLIQALGILGGWNRGRTR
ncbi:hypothetical protein GCM10023175_62520 [Pseudonocardia xishanensis]|uniref:Uncharacterized protein n=1 Tax=Pseudonocardia xishanensis TaxID=630995 RepID=A0ABP8S254_9PSEU